MTDNVIANDCIERDLVKDTGAVVTLDHVALIEHVVAVDIAPQARTEVVVYLIAAKNDTITQGELHTTGLPSRREPADIVRPNLIVLDRDVPTCAGNADLPVVLNVAAAHPAACSDRDSSPAVESPFAVLNYASDSVLGMDRHRPRHPAIFLIDDI